MNFSKHIINFIVFIHFVCPFESFGQINNNIDIKIVPTHKNWTYKISEQVNFSIKVYNKGELMKNVSIEYKIGLEQMPHSIVGTKILKNGSTQLEGIKLNDPGFVRCHVTLNYNNQKYSNWGTAAVEPEKIKPNVTKPKDFDSFWTNELNQLSKIPLDAKIELVPELCTSKIDVYHINIQNINNINSWMGNSRVYGMLSVPKTKGKYPAILELPGAGVRSYGRDDRAAKGIIVLKIGIHGIPVNLNTEFYTSLATGSLSNYQNYNLENKNYYYYKRVYLGCIRAIDYIFSLDNFDGENLATYGGSQGGALSIVTASLDKRVKYLVSFYPALCNLTGYIDNHAGGWPHMYKDFSKKENPTWKNTTSYYDVVNFAKTLKTPGWYSWGYNDNVCPPTSIYAAYNTINASSKELHLYYNTAHYSIPEQWNTANNWLYQKFGINP